MFELIFAIIIVSLVIYGQGIAFNRYVLKYNDVSENFYQTFFFGFIFLGFNVLLINFFFPINKLIGTLHLIFSISILIPEIIKDKRKDKIIKNIFIITFVVFFF